jgi:hypothetical protein
MKSSKAILGITLMSAMLFTSCGGDDAKPKTEDKTVKTADTTKKVEVPKVEAIAPAEISVKLYFKAWVFDEEGNEEGYEDGKERKGEVGEVGFDKTKTYTACYDSESYNNLKLVGTGKQLYLEVKAGNKIVFSKENFEVLDKVVFTTKDFDLDWGKGTHTVTLKQNETVLFSGKIKFQGCM